MSDSDTDSGNNVSSDDEVFTIRNSKKQRNFGSESDDDEEDKGFRVKQHNYDDYDEGFNKKKRSRSVNNKQKPAKSMMDFIKSEDASTSATKSTDIVEDDINETKFRKIIDSVNVKTKKNDDFSKLINENLDSNKNTAPSKKPPSIPAPPVKDMGKWEKHTKGFGKKFLEKFGFQGRLGANETGVTRAIEVVVRPEGLGLGFGDFKEATGLETNKKIEAEWHGKEYEAPKGGDHKPNKEGNNKSTSEARASSKSWKLGGVKVNESQLNDDQAIFGGGTGTGGLKGSVTKKKKGKVSFGQETVHDLFSYGVGDTKDQLGVGMEHGAGAGEVGGSFIIDMRGVVPTMITHEQISQQTLSKIRDPSYQPLLGEELLHNINMIVDNEELEAYQNNKKLHQIQTSMKSNSTMISELEAKYEVERYKLESYVTIQTMLDKIIGVIQKQVQTMDLELEDRSPQVSFRDVVMAVGKICRLYPTEVALLGLVPLIPQFTYDMLKVEVNNWDVNVNPMLVVDVYISWCQELDRLKISATREGSDVDEAVVLENTASDIAQAKLNVANLLEELIMPKLRRYFVSDWEVKINTKQCVDMVNAFKSMITQQNFAILVDMMILPKITQAVKDWNPTSDSIPIHSWIVPWIGLLENKLISSVFPDIRRKLGHALTRWSAQDPSALAVIQPWKGIFDESSLENFLIKNIIPKLVISMREQNVNPDGQDLAPFTSVLAWRNVVSRIHLDSILEGEFFPRWFRVLQYWLMHNPDFSEISAWYSAWKNAFPEDLCNDESILYYMNYALDMMATILNMPQVPDASVKDKEGVEALEKCMNDTLPLPSVLTAYQSSGGNMSTINYFKVLHKKQQELLTIQRYKELKFANSHATARDQSRHVKDKDGSSDQYHSQRAHAEVTATFKDVVEEFALRNDLTFTLKVDQYYNGKQLYSFQNAVLQTSKAISSSNAVICFIDQNVIFVKRKNVQSTNWTPVSLEDIVTMCR